MASCKIVSSLDDARAKFVEIMGSFRSDRERNDFLLWISMEYDNDKCKPGFLNELESVNKPDVDMKLNDIAMDIRKRVPQYSVFPSENLVVPTVGENKDCLPETTVHVDDFLYDDKEVDALVESGELKGHYCLDCGSRNTAPLTFISHSMSREKLNLVYNVMLPPNFTKKSTFNTSNNDSLCSCILDVGSRLGAALYAAYFYTDVQKLIGVEINADLCNLQKEICEKYKLQDRVEIINDDVLNQAQVVKSAQLIILNNPFEFFLEPCEQKKVWRFLKEFTSKGTILICVPALETSFGNLNMKSELKSWVKKREPYNMSAMESDAGEDLANMHMYIVL
ncbi:Hypothetical predicted protein [Cloeon dipterum]|uniref:Methyltransferase type 11 domain-containing protein n=1 Tax=Cloeon dipterum TaxID=197152 RepID=A0A8S1CJA1_9INSE|nr:Hypothetical predicted protein [Cloeon dipterum]